MTKLAVIQTAPVFLDKEKTISRAVGFVKQAVAENTDLIVFTEAFIPGYPAWVWRLRPGGDWGVSEELHARLLNNSVSLDGDDLAPLFDAAKKHKVTIVCGINERDDKHSQTTLYNTAIIIGPDGSLLNRHRKLMPTNPERMVWGFGDATGLKVTDAPCGKLGTLICWENYMPLARYALYAQGVEIYIAPTYDSGDDWIGTLKHIAREGGCWVVGCGNLMRGSDIPADFPERSILYPDEGEWINAGDSIVIAPGGEVMAGPMHEEDGILFCEVDLERAAISKRALDVTGHYSRPDIFTLHLNTKSQSPIEIE